MSNLFQTISPIDGSIFVERYFADDAEIAQTLSRGKAAQKGWEEVPVPERAVICRQALAILEDRQDDLGAEITEQMGRPIRYTPREISTMATRGRAMIEIAEEFLRDINVPAMPGFTRFIQRAPLGLVFAIVPWNYPYLTAMNILVTALLAGNSVLLKHSPQTPLCAERLVEAFKEAGLPAGVFQFLHLSDESADQVVRSPEVDFVAFTGSVKVGRMVQKAASDRFIGVGLELGGKDPAYVRADANFDHAVENLVDGVFFNSGQSCCSIERIYVHADLYDRFVEEAVKLTHTYLLGDPRNPETTLGPMVRTSAAEFVRAQIDAALHQGARALIDPAAFPASQPGTPYLAPQILVDVNHFMSVMRDESFGPVVGIMKVNSDEEAIGLMNDSQFGLTAAIWTQDLGAAVEIGDSLDTGTIFMNRCDYLDPELAWTGVKDSGRGCSLSRLGFEHVTRPKSFHLRA